MNRSTYRLGILNNGWHWMVRYGISILAVALAFLIQTVLEPFTQGETPFLLLSAAVLVSAAVGGLGAGVFATFLSALIGDYFFLSPVGTFVPPDVAHGLRSGLFLVQGLAISAIGAALVSARYKAELNARRAQNDQERLQFIAEVSAELSSSLDYRTTLASVARLAVPTLADWCTVDILEESGSLERLAVAHQDPEKVALAYELQKRYPLDPKAQYGTLNVLKTGEPEMVAEIPADLLNQAAQAKGTVES